MKKALLYNGKETKIEEGDVFSIEHATEESSILKITRDGTALEFPDGNFEPKRILWFKPTSESLKDVLSYLGLNFFEVKEGFQIGVKTTDLSNEIMEKIAAMIDILTAQEGITSERSEVKNYSLYKVGNASKKRTAIIKIPFDFSKGEFFVNYYENDSLEGGAKYGSHKLSELKDCIELFLAKGKFNFRD